MKRTSTIGFATSITTALAVSLVVTVPLAIADNDVFLGEVGTFTGADPGEGLDFEGVFPYAVNARGPGGFSVGDAQFTDDAAPGVTLQAENEILQWGGATNFGDSPDDDGLETVINSIRWSNRGTDPLRSVLVDLDGMIVGADYKLQLLFSERCCDRAYDILVEDELAVADFFTPALVGTPEEPVTSSTTVGAFFAYEFTAEDTVLNIELNGENTTHPDGNAILQGLTLEVQLDLIGDFNFDSAIDLADFEILLENMLTGNAYVDGDMDFSGTVDLHDFLAFKAAFQSGNAAAVPEPGSLLLAIMGIAALGLGFRYRRAA